jgi:hypothetical protein
MMHPDVRSESTITSHTGTKVRRLPALRRWGRVGAHRG